MTTSVRDAVGGDLGGHRHGRSGIPAHRLEHDIGVGADLAELVGTRKR